MNEKYTLACGMCILLEHWGEHGKSSIHAIRVYRTGALWSSSPQKNHHAASPTEVRRDVVWLESDLL